jgi:hypothetical protein
VTPRHSFVVIGVTVESARNGLIAPLELSVMVGSNVKGTPNPPAEPVPTDIARSASTWATVRIASASCGVISNCAVSGRMTRFQKARS